MSAGPPDAGPAPGDVLAEAPSGAYEPVADPAAAEARCAARLLKREGIPMLLALKDLTREPVPVRDERSLAEGPHLAALFEHYRGQLRPDAADADDEAVQDVLAVMAYCHSPIPRDPIPPGPVPLGPTPSGPTPR